MTPTQCGAPKCVSGKPNPVTLVATVVARKSAVQRSSRLPLSSPYTTTNPEAIPTRLIAVCIRVYVLRSNIILCLPSEAVCRLSLRLPLEEREQVGVNLILVGRAHAVRRARHDFKRGPFNELRGEECRVGDWYYLVVVAVHDERRHVELLEVFREVRLGERLDAVEDGFMPGQHPL